MSAITTTKRIINDGVMEAELNRFFSLELSECGYDSMQLRAAPNRYEIIIKVTKPQDALGPKGQRVREMTSILCKRFNLQESNLTMFIEKVANRGLSAMALAQSIKYKLLGGVAVRRAANGVLRFAMESGAVGVQVIIAGKTKGARAKVEKFRAGLMIHSGQPSIDFVDHSNGCSVELRQGILGIKVSIMKPQDSTGKNGPAKSMPDHITIHLPKEDRCIDAPYSETKAVVPVAVPVGDM